MITRFDHAVIAVSDLDRAVETYRSLGFDVFLGGRHEHRGTHNALIRFGGADYIELLGVYDPDKAVHSGLNGRTLAEFVRIGMEDSSATATPPAISMRRLLECAKPASRW
jgi:catechol 2,3-dioxygenase-like lactoylglutathione lyase family enzyme